MKKLALIVCLLLPVLSRGASPADEKFEKVASSCLDTYLEAHPEFATAVGDHRFDDRLTDYSKESRKKQLERAKESAAALKKFGRGDDLTAANRADLFFLSNKIAQEIFELGELKEADWNPQVYTESFGNGLYLLVSHDFDTPANRIAHLRKRMEAIPRVIEQAKANLQHPSAPATEAAIEQTRGAITMVRLKLDPLLDLVPEEKTKIEQLQSDTSTALEHYMKWLTQDLSKRSDGDFRLGQAKYKKKLSFVLGSDMSSDEMVKRARADLDTTRSALAEVARPLFAQLFAGEKAPNFGNDPAKMIQAVASKIGEKQHSEPATLLDNAKAVVTESLDFVKKHDLVTVPDAGKGIDVASMPEFKRSGAFIVMNPPGTLDANGKCLVEIAPPASRWPRSRQDSFYKEHNRAVLENLMIREGLPGRCLQHACAREKQTTTNVRKVFFDFASSAGWGTYCEKMMTDAGFGGPEAKFEQLRLRLLYDCAAIIDQGVHAGKMNANEALLLLKFQAFSGDAEQIAIWRQVRLQPAVFSAYTVGLQEQLDLLEKAKAKGGASFNLKKYHDEVLSYGGLPTRQIRELMGL